MAERGLSVDHNTVWRWVHAYAPEIRRRLQGQLIYKFAMWFMDETYERVAGARMCLFRAADGQTIDFYLSETRDREAAKRFHLMASRIGDLIVLGDRDTVFGELDAPSEPLPPEYRAHGSMHEMDVPLVIYNAHVQLKPEEFQYNRDLARWLYAG